jgi:hypothetical protein
MISAELKSSRHRINDRNLRNVMLSDSEASAFVPVHEKQILRLRLRMTIYGELFEGLS